MEINATLLGQMITFGLFVWFTMRFIWPLMSKTLAARQEKIAAGLQAAERGHKELELAMKFCVQEMRETREKITEQMEQARMQAKFIIEESRQEATQEKERIIAMGYAEIKKESMHARTELQKEVVSLIIASMERLLKDRLSEADQHALLKNVLPLKDTRRNL